jgi:hypothetical protein
VCSCRQCAHQPHASILPEEIVPVNRFFIWRLARFEKLGTISACLSSRRTLMLMCSVRRSMGSCPRRPPAAASSRKASLPLNHVSTERVIGWSSAGFRVLAEPFPISFLERCDLRPWQLISDRNDGGVHGCEFLSPTVNQQLHERSVLPHKSSPEGS